MAQVKLKPRPYQVSALRAMSDELVKNQTTQSGLVILPTGAGKTFIGSYFNTALMRERGLVPIWVAHRDELIKQAIEAHKRIDPDLNESLWLSNRKDASGDILFTSIQSTRGLAETIEAMHGANSHKYVLVVDEAHHFAAPDPTTGYKNMYAELYMGLLNAGLLAFCYGLTATAERLDGRPLAFKKVIYQMKFTDGVQAGFLAAPRLYEMRTQQQFHLDTTRKANGKRDYTDQDLRQLDNPQRNKKIAEEYVRHMRWRTNPDGTFKLDKEGKKIRGWGKTLFFAVNVAHCYSLAEELAALDPDLEVRVITGGTNDVERKEFRSWLAEGDIFEPKVAINCLVFTEGFDEPTINSIFLTRPTKSEALWMQMVGRGARIIKDPSTGHMIKDRFNLVSVMDDIGRYGALVKDWSISLLQGDQQKVTKIKRNRKSRIRAKRKLFTRISEFENVQTGQLSDAELIDVQGVLIFSTDASPPEGCPLDRDRMDCLRLLKEYLEKCFTTEQKKDGTLEVMLDLNMFANSYTHCVPANEFDHDTWRRISYAYRQRYATGLSEVRNKYSGKMQATWKFVPMVAMEHLDGQEAVSKAEKRISAVKENSARKNEQFNIKYNTRMATKRLYERIMDRLAEIGMPEQTLFVTKHVRRIVCKDRRMEIKLGYHISGSGDKNVGFIAMLNKKGTEVLQDILQDSAAEFRVVASA